MKYMLLIYGDENLLTSEERQECYLHNMGIVRELQDKGQFLGASPLQPSPQTHSVRVREGRPMVTSGPFTETHEQLGGYFLVDVPSLEEAVSIAARLGGAQWGAIEVRPLIELDGL